MMKYNIYHVNSYVYFDGLLPIARIKRRRLILSTTDYEYANSELYRLKDDKMNERSHTNYSVVDGNNVITDKHDHFFYMEVIHE